MKNYPAIISNKIANSKKMKNYPAIISNKIKKNVLVNKARDLKLIKDFVLLKYSITIVKAVK